MKVKRLSKKSDMSTQFAIMTRPPASLFEEDILSSELCSRGWVYQELRLTPANLLCAKNQMWWSCCQTTCSQVFPRGLPVDLTQSREGAIFVDSQIQCQKRALYSVVPSPALPASESWQYDWRRILRSYCTTSVSRMEDRVTAIAGIARWFAAHVVPLQGATFHSGLWSSDIIQQLLWSSTTSPGIYPRRLTGGEFPIPTWSPLSYFEPSGRPYQNWIDPDCQPVVKYVSIATSGLDSLGRAATQEDCALHLQGCSFRVEFDDLERNFYAVLPSPHTSRKEHTRIDPLWDFGADEEFVFTGPGLSLVALPVNIRRPSRSVFGTSVIFPRVTGLLLRASGRQVMTPDGRSVLDAWVRVGFFSKSYENDIHSLEDIFALWQGGAYGMDAKVSKSADASELEHGGTGETPKRWEDILII